jgi:hypothetical protein
MQLIATALLWIASFLVPPAALIDLLGSEDYATREFASAALCRLGESALADLGRAARRSDDAEVRRRAADAVASIRASLLERREAAVLAALGRSGYAAWPWMDSLPPDVPNRAEVVSEYLGRARAVGLVQYVPPDWPAYREATRLYVRDLLAAGRDEREVVELLRQMVEGDARQCRGRNHRWAGTGPLPLARP